MEAGTQRGAIKCALIFDNLGLLHSRPDLAAVAHDAGEGTSAMLTLLLRWTPNEMPQHARPLAFRSSLHAHK